MKKIAVNLKSNDCIMKIDEIFIGSHDEKNNEFRSQVANATIYQHEYNGNGDHVSVTVINVTREDILNLHQALIDNEGTIVLPKTEERNEEDDLPF